MKGNNPSLRGDKSEGVKIHRTFLKIFCRTSRPNSIKLGRNYPWMKETLVFFQLNGLILFKGEIITKL
jgi:hypothetical protein